MQTRSRRMIIALVLILSLLQEVQSQVPTNTYQSNVNAYSQKVKVKVMSNVSPLSLSQEMEQLTSAEKKELKEVRSKITKVLKASSTSSVEEEYLDDLQEKHESLCTTLTAHYERDNATMPEAVLEIIVDYRERIDAARRNRSLFESAVKQNEAVDQIKKLQEKLASLDMEVKRQAKQDKEKQGPELGDETSKTLKDLSKPSSSSYNGPQFYAKSQMESIPKFDGSQSRWPAFSLAVEDMIMNNEHLSEGQAKLALLQAIDASSEAYTRASTLYGRRLSLKDIWKLLVEKYNRAEQTETEVIKEAQALQVITEPYDVEGMRAAYECAAKVEAILSGLENPPAMLQSRLLGIFASKCHPLLQHRIIRNCQNMEELVKELDLEWLAVQRFTLLHPALDKSKTSDKGPRRVNTIQTTAYPNPNAQGPVAGQGNQQRSGPERRPPPAPVCHFCQEVGHFTDVCSGDHSTAVKLERILSRNLCWNCLKPGHAAEVCYGRKVCCQLCGKDHKTVVHAVWEVYQEQLKGQNQGARIHNVEETRQGSEDLKPVGIIQVNGSYCMVLIDTGADRSMIAGSLVKESKRRNIQPIWFVPYEAKGFYVKEEATLSIRCLDGSSMPLTALVKRDYGANQLILGVDYLSTLRLPPIRTPFGVFEVGSKGSPPKTVEMVMNLERTLDAPELTEEAEGRALMRIELSDKRFVAYLPFVNDQRPPNNFEPALRLLDRAQRRMSDELLESYEGELYQYIKEGYAVRTEDPSGNFLPHFAVHKDSITTKVRIVFDGSYGTNSLNNNLYKGATPGLHLEEKLIKLRTGRYAALVDIAKAFLQIAIAEGDQRFLKFLWRNKEGELQMFRFTALPFGLVSSPAILEQCLKMIVAKLSKPAQALFERSIYMDDALLVADHEAVIRQALCESMPCFLEYGFQMHKLVSNSEAAVAGFETLPGTAHKVLGMAWNTEEDQLQVRIPNIQAGPVTKRFLLHVLGSLFDPIGLVDPVKLKLKRILSLCSEGLDVQLSVKIADVVKEFLKDLPLLKSCQVKRHCPGHRLLGYSDASKEAYGYCFYIADNANMTFLYGKSKIVPANVERSTPELELAALYIMTKKVVEIIKVLGPKVTSVELMSDSMLNLQRLAKPLNNNRSFVASKLVNILKIATMYDIRFLHVDGVRNPADAYSRLTSITEFTSYKDRYQKPVPRVNDSYAILKVFALGAEGRETPEESDAAITKMIRGSLSESLSRIIVFLSAIRKMKRSMTPYVPPCRSEALVFLLSQLQHLVPTEKAQCPLIKRNGLWCVRTRIVDHTPILFPAHQPLTEMLIVDTHCRLGHAGRDRVCGELTQEFLIIGLKKKVQSVIQSCVFCTHARKAPVSQPIGYWPAARTEFTRAFEVVAVDIFGPLVLMNQRKAYGLIYVCQLTRAVKVEVLPSLDAKDLLMAMETLFCLLGEPALIFSDNGTNFRKVAKDCSNIVNSLRKVLENTVNWSFAPPDAPWFNATAERLIGSVKRILNTIGPKLKSHQELRHVFAQAERIINSRELFNVDGESFSPFYLWQYRKPRQSVFRPSKTSAHPYKFAKFLAVESDRLKQLWERNYRNMLCLQKSDKRLSQLHIGQKVLMPDRVKKRLNWTRAIITRTFPGVDGIVRVVELAVKDREKPFLRPANGLVLFEGDARFVQTPSPEDVAGKEPAERGNRDRRPAKSG